MNENSLSIELSDRKPGKEWVKYSHFLYAYKETQRIVYFYKLHNSKAISYGAKRKCIINTALKKKCSPVVGSPTIYFGVLPVGFGLFRSMRW